MLTPERTREVLRSANRAALTAEQITDVLEWAEYAYARFDASGTHPAYFVTADGLVLDWMESFDEEP